jgi:hypothetical protein
LSAEIVFMELLTADGLSGACNVGNWESWKWPAQTSDHEWFSLAPSGVHPGEALWLQCMDACVLHVARADVSCAGGPCECNSVWTQVGTDAQGNPVGACRYSTYYTAAELAPVEAAAVSVGVVDNRCFFHAPTPSPSAQPTASPTSSPTVTPATVYDAEPAFDIVSVEVYVDVQSDPLTSFVCSPRQPGFCFDRTVALLNGLQTYWDNNLRAPRCTDGWQCDTFGHGACEYPVWLADRHVPWLNGGATAAKTPGIRKLGYEGGCECASDRWDHVLFCSDCTYGYGPRRTTDFEGDVCSNSLAAQWLPLAACAAPYGLDPVLASLTDAYKLCAGHGTWGGAGTQCACFRDDDRGYWALAEEDGAATHTCRACLSPALGPKPATVADLASRQIGRDQDMLLYGIDNKERQDASCLLKPAQACARVGQFDPDLAFVEDVDERDAHWVQCAGHGAWNGTACACARGWALRANDDLFGGDAYRSCWACHPLFGPAVPALGLVAWGAADDPPVGPFCVAPTAPDPMTGIPAACAGHGIVVPRRSPIEDYQKPCRCFGGLDTGYWAVSPPRFAPGDNTTSVQVCDRCRAGWGPAPGIAGAAARTCRERVGVDPETGAAGAVCAGHGTWDGEACGCEAGWAMAPGSKVCGVCADGWNSTSGGGVMCDRLLASEATV